MKALACFALVGVVHAAPTVVVGRPSGLYVVGLDGVVAKKLSATAAAQPRVTADGARVVFLRRAAVVKQDGKERQTYDELRTVALDGTHERKLADVPSRWAGPCKDEDLLGKAPPLFLYSERGFVVDDRDRACMSLTDYVDDDQHEGDTLDVRVEASGAAQRLLLKGDGYNRYDRCGPAPGSVALEQAECNSARIDVVVQGARAATPARPKAVYKLSGKGIVRIADNRRIAPLATKLSARHGDAALGSTVLVDDEAPEDDFARPRQYLLDESTGSLRPVVAGPWPAPLTLAQLRKLDVDTASGRELRTEVIGDVLLIGSLVVKPGSPIIDLGGDVALRTTGSAWEPEPTEEEKLDRGWKPR